MVAVASVERLTGIVSAFVGRDLTDSRCAKDGLIASGIVDATAISAAAGDVQSSPTAGAMHCSTSADVPNSA
jgi:hypothetical protein